MFFIGEMSALDRCNPVPIGLAVQSSNFEIDLGVFTPHLFISIMNTAYSNTCILYSKHEMGERLAGERESDTLDVPSVTWA